MKVTNQSELDDTAESRSKRQGAMRDALRRTRNWRLNSQLYV